MVITSPIMIPTWAFPWWDSNSFSLWCLTEMPIVLPHLLIITLRICMPKWVVCFMIVLFKSGKPYLWNAHLAWANHILYENIQNVNNFEGLEIQFWLVRYPAAAGQIFDSWGFFSWNQVKASLFLAEKLTFTEILRNIVLKKLKITTTFSDDMRSYIIGKNFSCSKCTKIVLSLFPKYYLQSIINPRNCKSW